MNASPEYVVALQYLGRVLQAPPDRDFLEQTRDLPADFAGWEQFNGCDTTALALPKHITEALQKDIAADHLHLFSGPEAIAPPWESVWRERDKLLFGECTAQIASLYADWDLATANEGREPEDHLGLEVSFLGWLLLKKLEEPELRAQSGQNLDEAILEILDGHLLKFAPPLLEKAADNALTPYYAAVCRLCAAALANLRSEIG